VKQNSLLYYLLTGALIGLLLVLFVFLYFPPYDYSYQQTADRKTFGSVMQTLADPYYQAVDNKLRSIAESRGDILISRDARYRGDKQLEQIYELIEYQPDGIFVSAVDWTQLTPALKAAEDAGIPVIALDASPTLENVSATVSTDPYAAGVLCAGDLMSRLPAARIIVLGQPGNRYSDAFVRGFRESLGKDYRIVAEGDSSRQIAASSHVCSDLLDQASAVDAIVVVNDHAAIGALTALEWHNLDRQVLLYGVDGSPAARAAIQKGLMAGSVARYPYELAQLAGDAMYALLDWQELEQTDMYIEIQMITTANIDDYELTSWQ